MAKFGYRCQCGWKLSRANKTRKQYAESKRVHANGDGGENPGCQFLAQELSRTKVGLPKVKVEASE
jgi:hypothetical protein